MIVSTARSLAVAASPRLIAAAMMASTLFPKVVWAQEPQSSAQQSQVVVTQPAKPSHRRLVATLVGAGAGIGLGLLAGVKGIPEATCKDGKVWAVAGAFGAAGGLLGNMLGGRSSAGRYDLTQPGNSQPLDAATVREVASHYRFSDASARTTP